MTEAFVVRPHRRLFDPETRRTTHESGRIFSNRVDIPPAQEDRVVVFDDADESPVPAPGGLDPYGTQDSFPPVEDNPIPFDDANTSGWSNFAASGGGNTQIIYVSPEGSDGNNGLFPDNIAPGVGPKATPAGGKAAIRNNKADWLLLRRGRTFTGSGGFGTWTASGISATERVLISSYGTGARPIVDTGTQTGLSIFNAVDHFAIVGIEFFESGHVGTWDNRADGLYISAAGCNNLLIEDCYIHNFGGGLGNGITFYDTAGTMTNVVVRRNVICDTWTRSSTGANGIYSAGIDGGIFEENLILNNGSSAQHPLNQVFGHNMYLATGSDNTLVVRGNVISSTDGIQVRSGGMVRNNLFLNLFQALVLGSGYQTNHPTGVHGSAIGNVFLDGGSYWSGSEVPGGIGITVENFIGGEVAYNLIANNVSGNNPVPLRLMRVNQDGGPSGVAVSDCDIHHNVLYKWGGRGFDFEGNLTGTTGGNRLNNNDCTAKTTESLVWHNDVATYSTSYLETGQVGNNRWYRAASAATAFHTGSSDVSVATYQTNFASTGNTFVADPGITYPGPTRSVSTWFTALGVCHGITPDGTLASYIAALKLQSRNDWIAELMPTYGQPDILLGPFADYLAAGNLQSVEAGPIRYLRNGFTDTTNKFASMGVTLASLSPATGSKDGGTPVTLTGTNFIRTGSNATDQTSITRVLFNGNPAGDVIVVSATSITCTSPASNLPSPYTGVVDVQVDTGDGIATKTAAFNYT